MFLHSLLYLDLNVGSAGLSLKADLFDGFCIFKTHQISRHFFLHSDKDARFPPAIEALMKYSSIKDSKLQFLRVLNVFRKLVHITGVIKVFSVIYLCTCLSLNTRCDSYQLTYHCS